MKNLKSIIPKLMYVGLIMVLLIELLFSKFGFLNQIRNQELDTSELLVGLILLMIYLVFSHLLLVKHNKTLRIRSSIQSLLNNLKDEKKETIERPRIY